MGQEVNKGLMQEIKMHKMLMSMINLIKMSRKAYCEHCEALLMDIYRCMDNELKDMKDGSK
jgi:hypothetical protein